MAVFDPTCPLIKALILLDSDGKRIAVKYYGSEWCVLLLACSCLMLCLC